MLFIFFYKNMTLYVMWPYELLYKKTPNIFLLAEECVSLQMNMNASIHPTLRTRQPLTFPCLTSLPKR